MALGIPILSAYPTIQSRLTRAHAELRALIAPTGFVAYLGTSRALPGDPAFERARRVGEVLADRGVIVGSGAAGGVMDAVSQGNARNGIQPIGFLTEEWRDSRSRNILPERILWFDDLYTRELALLFLSAAVILDEGGAGSMRESANYVLMEQLEHVKRRKPFVVIAAEFWKGQIEQWRTAALRRHMDPFDLGLVQLASSAETAVDLALGGTPALPHERLPVFGPIYECLRRAERRVGRPLNIAFLPSIPSGSGQEDSITLVMALSDHNEVAGDLQATIISNGYRFRATDVPYPASLLTVHRYEATNAQTLCLLTCGWGEVPQALQEASLTFGSKNYVLEGGLGFALQTVLHTREPFDVELASNMFSGRTGDSTMIRNDAIRILWNSRLFGLIRRIRSVTPFPEIVTEGIQWHERDVTL
jgi:predicted Rossmann-fold nucleotide-binding protein